MTLNQWIAKRVQVGALLIAALLPVAARATDTIDEAVGAAERGVTRAPKEAAGYVALASAFMRKAAATGEAGYYARARAAVEQAETLAPDDYQVLRTRAWVLLGLHEFRQARAVAEEAQRREPRDWWNYGTLTDACVELGDYPAAVAAADRMAELRPGVPSYTRVAFLRTLLGDRAGAIEMLQEATRMAGDAESRGWTLVHLGLEHWGRGALAPASAAIEEALRATPESYLALAALARVRAAQGRFAEAATLYERATTLVPAPDLVGALGDVYALLGRTADARQAYALVEFLQQVAASRGAMFGRQIALFFADHDRRLDVALALARAEARQRQDIYTEDALAWALFKNGMLRQAARASHRARRLGTEDAALHYHAGVIAAALGRPARARRELGLALALNPQFDVVQAAQARQTLAALEGGQRG